MFLYKRAQIWVGDVWGAFGGKGLGDFGDISCLTMFADYRVPVTLKDLGILVYTADVEAKVPVRLGQPRRRPHSPAVCRVCYWTRPFGWVDSLRCRSAPHRLVIVPLLMAGMLSKAMEVRRKSRLLR